MIATPPVSATNRARFPRAARVRAPAQYKRVFDQGRRTASPLLALHWLQDGQPPRLGLAVSRKVDPDAVGRNRVKRQWREQFRRLRWQLPAGAYVVVARPAAAACSNTQLRDALVGVLQRSGALPPPDMAGTMPGSEHPDRPSPTS